MVVSNQMIRHMCLSQHNETHQDWKMQAEVCGEGFSGPKVLNVPAGTRASYPLTFHPSAQCIVMVISFFVVVSLFLPFFGFPCLFSVFLWRILAV